MRTIRPLCFGLALLITSLLVNERDRVGRFVLCVALSICATFAYPRKEDFK